MRFSVSTRSSSTALLFCIAVAASRVSAQDSSYTQEELRALPRVCHAQKFIHETLQHKIVPEAERRLWEDRLGEKDYLAFHHYCWALIDLRRASAATKADEQAFHYKWALGNFDYVQRHASDRFALMPEVNLRKGQTLRLTGQDQAAAKEFISAIQLKPDYTPAYAALIDLYRDLDDVQGAEQVLARGLVQAPGSKILLQKKAELESSPYRK